MNLDLENKALQETDDAIENIKNLVVRKTFSFELNSSLLFDWRCEMKFRQEVNMLGRIYLS